MVTRKTPQDRKPAAGTEFEFEHDGNTYTLPKFGSWKSALIRRVRKLDGVDGTYTILEEICKDGSGYESSLEALDDMDMDGFNAVMQAWQDHAGVTLGE